MGKNVGKSSTARRKGGRNANKTPLTAIVDRQSSLPNTAAAQSTVTSPLATTIRPPDPIQAQSWNVSLVRPFPSTWHQVLQVQSFSAPRTSQGSQTLRLQSCCTTPQPQVLLPNATQQQYTHLNQVLQPTCYGCVHLWPLLSRLLSVIKACRHGCKPSTRPRDSFKNETKLSTPVYRGNEISTRKSLFSCEGKLHST